jgi:hypothetical protein
MNRCVVALLLLLVGVSTVEPALAARRVVVRRPARQRTVVVVHRGWPLRRAPRAVFVRPARAAVVVTPAVFLAPVAFSAVALATVPPRDVLVWEDSEVLDKQDDWTEFTLNCATRGTQLFLEIASGRVQFDWAEVVFENGDAQVVDFAERVHGPGFYSLLDFRDGRKVDHVRVVARARTDEAKVVLRIAR